MTLKNEASKATRSPLATGNKYYMPGDKKTFFTVTAVRLPGHADYAGGVSGVSIRWKRTGHGYIFVCSSEKRFWEISRYGGFIDMPQKKKTKRHPREGRNPGGHK